MPLDGLISKLDTTEERISELQDMSIEISQTVMHRKKRISENERTSYQNL